MNKFGIGLACIGLGLSIGNIVRHWENAGKSGQLAEDVQTHNPNKYTELLQKGVKECSRDLKIWEQTAQEVRDSLIIDSVAKTNYAKGAQMVRDSIAKANSNNIKTIIKLVK